MKITFQLRFSTHPGQSLFLCGDHPRLGNGNPEQALPMEYVNAEFWRVTLDLPDPAAEKRFGYFYAVRGVDGDLKSDSPVGREIDQAGFHSRRVLIIDAWNFPGYVENAFYTEPFQQVLLQRNQTPAARFEADPGHQGRARCPERAADLTRRAGDSAPYLRREDSAPYLGREASGLARPLAAATHTFRVKTPVLGPGQTLCLLGSSSRLANWNTAEPILLSRQPGDTWFSTRLDLSGQPFPLEYKYGVYDTEKREFLSFEAGPNRVLRAEAALLAQETVLNDGFAALPPPTWKGAGVAIPVFSLRSERSFGIGEFPDLKPLVDWCGQTGLRLIQLLPINDTTASHTWTDSYPYAAISAFALHPLYANLEAIASPRHRSLLDEAEAERHRLNALEAVDYEAVLRAKLPLLRRLFAEQRAATSRSNAYRGFVADNRDWLEPYTAFCALRDRHGTPDFSRWPEHATFTPQTVETLNAKGSWARDEIAFHCFVQYHLHAQLREAVDYAHSHGVILKGDLAIGVGRYGADTWQWPELFHMDKQAGAPPDAFAAGGQNWSFPTYNWPRLRETGFAWWRRRFEQLGRYFDAIRIDHILGFFRIWSIPSHAVEGLLGYFVPSLPVTPSELAARGIPFDRDRFVRPHITNRVLESLFGLDAETVKRNFLDRDRPGQWSLKPQFATQRQVEHHFAALPSGERQDRIKLGLYSLIANVILLQPEAGRHEECHFRFGIEQTSSFQDLDAATRDALKELYVDYFYRRQESFWMRQGEQKLPALKRATEILICGEDLGMVPACVPMLMKELGLLSLEIQRMPKVMADEFSRPRNAPYLSVVTPSTHDMSTLRGWWEEDRALTQRFFNHELTQPGSAPPTCEPWVSRAIVRQHLESPAMWSIFQLQDLLGLEERLRRKDVAAERINIPANPRHYWRYRMHLTLEQLLGEKAFTDGLRSLVRETGR